MIHIESPTSLPFLCYFNLPALHPQRVPPAPWYQRHLGRARDDQNKMTWRTGCSGHNNNNNNNNNNNTTTTTTTTSNNNNNNNNNNNRKVLEITSRLETWNRWPLIQRATDCELVTPFIGWTGLPGTPWDLITTHRPSSTGSGFADVLCEIMCFVCINPSCSDSSQVIHQWRFLEWFHPSKKCRVCPSHTHTHRHKQKHPPSVMFKTQAPDLGSSNVKWSVDRLNTYHLESNASAGKSKTCKNSSHIVILCNNTYIVYIYIVFKLLYVHTVCFLVCIGGLGW